MLISCRKATKISKPRAITQDRTRLVGLTERDRRIADLVYRFRLLSRDQLMKLAPFGSLTRANTRLAALVRAGLLSRKMLPVYPGNGSAQALYFLGRAADAILNLDKRSLAQQHRQISRWDVRQVEHVSAANGVLVDFLVSLGRSSTASLVAYQTEPELRQLFLDRSLVPDGWIAWTEQGKRFNCFLEVDLHHEGLSEWRDKVLRYLAYAESGAHEEHFGFRSFRVVVIAKSHARLERVRRVASQAGRLFVFAEMSKVTSENIPGKVWLSASGDGLIALTEA